ncbi:hypothetical protein DB42_EU00020 [Neochlamydia sp. EPS4]|nr:hypothetical protein DB42_EU00020 [Neochlamydia sp. EPS4]
MAKSFLFHFSPPRFKSTYGHSTIENAALFFRRYPLKGFPLIQAFAAETIDPLLQAGW